MESHPALPRMAQPMPWSAWWRSVLIAQTAAGIRNMRAPAISGMVARWLKNMWYMPVRNIKNGAAYRIPFRVAFAAFPVTSVLQKPCSFNVSCCNFEKKAVSIVQPAS